MPKIKKDMIVKSVDSIVREEFALKKIQDYEKARQQWFSFPYYVETCPVCKKDAELENTRREIMSGGHRFLMLKCRTCSTEFQARIKVVEHGDLFAGTWYTAEITLIPQENMRVPQYSGARLGK